MSLSELEALAESFRIALDEWADNGLQIAGRWQIARYIDLVKWCGEALGFEVADYCDRLLMDWEVSLANDDQDFDEGDYDDFDGYDADDEGESDEREHGYDDEDYWEYKYEQRGEHVEERISLEDEIVDLFDSLR